MLGVRNREGGEFTVKGTLPDLAGDQEDVCTILSHAFLHRDRRCRSAFVSGTDGAQASSAAEPASRLIDRVIARLPWFRTIGDHMLIHFERVEARCC
jgi:hypothetical protein